MTIKLAELVADAFVSRLDMAHLTKTQIMVLHGIKTASIGDWAKHMLKQLKEGTL